MATVKKIKKVEEKQILFDPNKKYDFDPNAEFVLKSADFVKIFNFLLLKASEANYTLQLFSSLLELVNQGIKEGIIHEVKNEVTDNENGSDNKD